MGPDPGYSFAYGERGQIDQEAPMHVTLVFFGKGKKSMERNLYEIGEEGGQENLLQKLVDWSLPCQ